MLAGDIPVIDVGGNGVDTLKLDELEVESVANGTNSVIIVVDAHDVIIAGGWTLEGTRDQDGFSFTVYKKGNSEVLVTLTNELASFYDRDFGDAPDGRAGSSAGDYRTTSEDQGPSHIVVDNLFLGLTVDTEGDGVPDSEALGDDSLLPSNDEDGLTSFENLGIGFTPTATLIATNDTISSATLYGWIDFNGDGVFAITERASAEVAAGSVLATATLLFPAIPGDAVAATFARFRFSTDSAAASPFGPADDGEVEDHFIRIDDGNEGPRGDSVGVHRRNLIYQDTSPDFKWNGLSGGDTVAQFGIEGDVLITGDWNGNGYDDVGVHRGNVFYLDMNGSRRWDDGDVAYRFGNPGDTPIVGDWDGDGASEIGVHRDNFFYKDVNGNGKWDSADRAMMFGTPTDTPLVGDWDGDGISQIGVHRGNQFYLDLDNDGSYTEADVQRQFGIEGDTPLIGDWNGDGADDLGIHRAHEFFLDTNGDGAWSGVTGGDRVFSFGAVGDAPVSGNWEPAEALVANGRPVALPATDKTAADKEVAKLAQHDLSTIKAAAIDVLASVGLSAPQVAALRSVQVRVGDLAGDRLGLASGNFIVMDVDAAGHGWFVDPTPQANEEFRLSASSLTAAGDSAAQGQMDLLTVMIHELQHVLGLDDDFSDRGSNHVMNGWLRAGVRRLPSASDLS